MKIIRIGPDRAYPLHFTRPHLLLLLPVLLDDKNDGRMGWNLFLFVFEPYPLELSNCMPLIQFEFNSNQIRSNQIN